MAQQCAALRNKMAGKYGNECFRTSENPNKFLKDDD